MHSTHVLCVLCPRAQPGPVDSVENVAALLSFF